MPVFPKLVIDPPKMSHHNRSHYFDTSMAPGLLYPLAVIPVNANEEHRIDVESLINTQALLSPLYGSYQLQISAFFAGISLYVPQLWHNATMVDSVGVRLNVYTPYFNFNDTAAMGSTAPLSSSHLLAYLGHGVGEVFITPDSTTRPISRVNAIPLLMYYDIFRNYFANRQEEDYYAVSQVEDGKVTLGALKLDGLDQIFTDLPKKGGDITKLLQFFGAQSVLDGAKTSLPLFGLLTTCFPKDRMTVFLNDKFVTSNKIDTRVMVENGNFQIDQLVTAKKLWDSSVKDRMISPTFKDWVRAHFGVTPKIMDDIPTYLGSSYSDLYFEDIRATANGYAADAEGNPVSNYLGDKASSGKGYVHSRMIRCFADRPGYIMVLARLVPRPKYYQFAERYTQYRSLSDLFRPEYNGIGLQDALVSDFNVSMDHVNSGNFDSNKYLSAFTTAVGKHPAWIEYMTAVDKIRGTFCTTEKSWVLARDFALHNDDQSVNTYPVDMPFPTSYINPGEWNQPFAVQDLTAQNFLAQFYIKHTLRSTVSKRLLPWL